MEGVIIIICIFNWLAFAFLTALAAPARGRNSAEWLKRGLLFGVFALIAVLVMPSLNDPTPETHLQCPDCAEFVRKEARICKHCGCKLRATSNEPWEKSVAAEDEVAKWAKEHNPEDAAS